MVGNFNARSSSLELSIYYDSITIQLVQFTSLLVLTFLEYF